MKKLYAGLLVGFALVACTPAGSGVQPTPTPIVVPESTPSPVASATPSQEELSAEAERVYRTFFNEWIRLEREGGAEEPTQILKDNGSERYVDAIMTFLSDQKAQGVTVEGPLPSLSIRPAPGSPYGSADPRMTIEVCEDHRAGWSDDGSGKQPGKLVHGLVFLGVVSDRTKVVWSQTEVVDECPF